MSINNVTLVGNCGRDPEVRYFESGSCVAEFSLALNNPDKDGQPQDPDWIEVKVWGKTAQVAADYLRKGHRVGIVGRLKQERWTDDGGKRSKLVVVADRLELLQPRERSVDDAVQPTRQPAAAPTRRPAAAQPASQPVDNDELIPF